MVLVGVYHHVVLLSVAVESTTHLDSVLEVNVIISSTVDDKKTCLIREAVCEVDGRVIVVALRSSSMHHA